MRFFLFWSKNMETPRSAGVSPATLPFRREASQAIASLGEGGVARRSRVTEGVGAENGQKMTPAASVTAATPSDSPKANLPQEEGFQQRKRRNHDFVAFQAKNRAIIHPMGENAMITSQTQSKMNCHF
jgi:hypothetical protein